MLFSVADGKTYALHAIFHPYLGHATNTRNTELLRGVANVGKNAKTGTNPYS